MFFYNVYDIRMFTFSLHIKNKDNFLNIQKAYTNMVFE